MSKEQFSFQKLGDKESHVLESVLNMLVRDYGATVDETSDQVLVTALNKAGEKVTYGFTKVGDELTVAGHQINFSRLIAKTIEEKCQKKIAE